METVLRLCGIALIGVIASLLFKERYSGAKIAAVIAAFLLISSYVMENSVKDAVETVGTYVNGSDFSGYAKTLTKALGIAYITSATEHICKEAGEGTVAAAVEFCGKAQLVLLSLPLISSLLDIAAKLS